jgi:hypothetical protein
MNLVPASLPVELYAARTGTTSAGIVAVSSVEDLAVI